MKLATELEFFAEICSLESLEMLESDYHLVTALIVESWPGKLQMIHNGWKMCSEAAMGFPLSEAYSLPMNPNFLWDCEWQIYAGAITIGSCRMWGHPARGKRLTRPSRYPSLYKRQECQITRTTCLKKCGAVPGRRVEN